MAGAIEWLEEPDWAKLVAAEKLAETAVARAPGAAGAWKSLILTQKRMGKMALAQASIAKASAAIGDGLAGRKAFLAALLELEENEHVLAQGETLPPDDDVRALLRDAAIRSNRLGPAQCRALAREDYTVNQAWAAARDADDLRRLVAQCRAKLVENPIHTDARYTLAHALAKLGDGDAARAAMAIDIFPRIAMLGGDGEETRAAVASELRVNPTLVQDPHNKATRDGLQAAKLGLPGEPTVEGLLARIKSEIQRYCDALEGIDDPYVTARPTRAKLSSWAVIYGAAGRQSAHRHPGGWLSGVYYVSAPRTAEGYRGALLMGAPDQRLGKVPPWPVRRIEPIPGQLVLFPSFVPHATEPCGTAGERISVAFDVIPFEPKAAP